jgi:hypothetical protein
MSTNEYGPNSAQVKLFIDRLKVLTDKEVKRIAAWDAVWVAARDAAWDVARSAAWDAACIAARGAAWDAIWEATRNITRNTAWNTAWNTNWAARAIVVMDLISEEQFTILTEPFAEILVELGIVWERK